MTVDADGIGRFPQATEAAVYFCCLEALQNIAKYAHATQARICLQRHNRTLRFTVSDDGAGYDTSHTPLGSGQRNMADRLAALGGSLEVRSARSQGTTITGHLPAPSLARQLGPAHKARHIRAQKPPTGTGNRGHSQDIRATPEPPKRSHWSVAAPT